MSTCHVDNVCRAAILAAELGTGGSSYFVSDGADGTLRAVITALLATRNVVPPKATVPFGVGWWMARCMEAAWRIFRIGGEPPITRQMLRMIGMAVHGEHCARPEGTRLRADRHLAKRYRCNEPAKLQPIEGASANCVGRTAPRSGSSVSVIAAAAAAVATSTVIRRCVLNHHSAYLL
jgi:hypothetical protein